MFPCRIVVHTVSMKAAEDHAVSETKNSDISLQFLHDAAILGATDIFRLPANSSMPLIVHISFYN
jgi:hypothetical protein